MPESNFKAALAKLCQNQYTRRDVHIVVTQMHATMKQILLSRIGANRFYIFTGTGHEREIEDLALDFIAAKLDRDDSGRFTTLSHYFDKYLGKPDLAFSEVYWRFMHSTFIQSSRLYYGAQDHFGSKFHESLKYILKKHPGWEKVKNNSGTVYIQVRDGSEKPAELVELEAAYQRINGETRSLTATIENMTCLLLQEKGLKVYVPDLIRYLRQVFRIEDHYAPTQDKLPPDLQNLLNDAVHETRIEIENRIMQKYLRAQKLTLSEFNILKKALELLIYDVSVGQDGQSYYLYLSDASPDELSMDEYRHKYRTRFEYIGKETKKVFSAKLRSLVIH